MKTYVVADLHGRYDLLMKALDLAVEDSGEEPADFICTGDFVDRGPQSCQIINQLMEGRYKNLTIRTIKGNHEDMMCQVIDDPSLMYWWQGNGGGRTLASYKLNYDALIALQHGEATGSDLERHYRWLKGLPVFLEDDLRFYVHAGVNYDLPVEEQNPDVMMWIMTEKDGEYPAFHGKHVVHGHMQYEDGPILKENRTNLDTFAWDTGRLAVGVFDNTQAKPIKILEAIGEEAPFGKGGGWLI